MMPDLVFSCYFVLHQGLKPRVAYEGVLCGPRCFLEIFK